ncbi:MAG: hypothetical protein QM706_17980 [Nitrospira sp.]
MDRIIVLSALIERLPEGDLGKILTAVQNVDAPMDRSCVLSELAQPLTLISKEGCYQHIATTVTRLAQRVRNCLFSDLSALLPVLIHIGTDDIPREIYEASTM